MAPNYKTLYEGKIDDVIAVEKYQSTQSGMTVVIAQVEGPVVNGFFCLATEAHDDDGLPHTLEHLVFMGSEKYPFKGVLDLLANRCLASGTNAWTDTDHTCYTITNAGSEGFLIMLPIYLDHVLFPTLTEAAYVTEVHHVNGEGENAGVVYCEMQARENTGDSRTHLEMLRAMYPGRCGYKSETGGIMKNLRESTSHTKVVDYHKEFYRPENLCIIITGEISPEEVFKALEPIETKIMAKGDRPAHVRPWQDPVPPLTATHSQIVEYPADDEESGLVTISWRGYKSEDIYMTSALHTLLEYLTDTSAAPLQQHFVELDDPYCNDVRFHMIENSSGCFEVKFDNVPTEKLEEIKGRLMGKLQKLAKGDEKIDMPRMQDVIHRAVLDAKNHLESRPHDTIAFNVIGDFLYGNTVEDFETRMNPHRVFEKLHGETVEFWVKMISSLMLDQPYVQIIGQPSIELMTEMGNVEKKRVEDQRSLLGTDGLKAKAIELEKSIEKNETPLPPEMVTEIPVPGVDSIHFHQIKTACNFSKKDNTHTIFTVESFPLHFTFDDIKSNFAEITVQLSTDQVPPGLRRYLSLFTEIVLESPVRRDGELIPYEQVVKELNSDTLENGVGIGAMGASRFNCGRFPSCIQLELEVEIEKYVKAITWCRELLSATEFTPERIKVVASKMAKDVTKMKRKGQKVVGCIVKDMLFSKDSNTYNNNMLRQYKFLTDLVASVDAGKSDDIIKNLNEIRRIICRPSNIHVHVAMSADRVKKFTTDPVSDWKSLLAMPNSPCRGLSFRKSSDDLLAAAGRMNGVIAGVGSVESSYLMQLAPCYKEFDHPDQPALLLLLQYLTQLEGPLWRQIRGLGLAYHFMISDQAESGQIQLILARATHVVDAYKKALEVVEGYMNGTTPFTDMEMQSARSSLIFELIEVEQTPKDASTQSFLNILKGIPRDHKKKIIAAIPGITEAELLRVGKVYLNPLFSVAQSQVAICCHPTKVQEICKGMKELGRNLQEIQSLDDSFLAQF